MPTFETLPRFDRDWKNLTAHQQAAFRRVITESFVPDLSAIGFHLVQVKLFVPVACH